MEILRKMSIKSSWEELKNAADSGMLADILKSGDQIMVTLKDGRKIALDAGRDASGKFYFICHDCLTKGSMNRNGTNKGGWRDSDMRAFLNAEIFSLFPDDVQAVMRPTKIVQVVRGETLESEDKLFLLSATQVFGDAGCCCERGFNDSQIDIFAVERNRVKECEDKGTWYWWLRSPYASNSNYFCSVNTDGTITHDHANYSIGVAPAFCIE